MSRFETVLGRLAASVLLAFALSFPASAQQAAPVPAPSTVEVPLFAVEITVGSKWDASKPPQDQQFFKEHSANLKRLRDSGNLIMGARYSDKGLVVVAAENEAAVRAMMEDDPSIKAETFKFEVHPFNVFYGGELKPQPRKPAPK